MPAPLSNDLRERVVNAWLAGELTQPELAKRFAVGLKTVSRWTVRYRRTGSVVPDPSGGARRPYIVDNEGAQMIRDCLDCVADTTLVELCALYAEERGIAVSPQTMSDTVRRLGYSRKRGLFVG